MYPLKSVIISCDDDVVPNIRRELLNAHVELDGVFPNIPSVIERLTLRHDETRLFIVHLDSIDDLAPLKHLSGVFAGRPILALFDGDPPATAVVHAMREGAAQVVLLPFSSEDFQEALRSIEAQFGHTVGKSRLIAVTGSHGGAGATTIAVNLAYEIAQTFQLDCILLELSSNVGVLSSYLSIEPKHTTRDLLELGEGIDVYALQRALVPFGERLSVMAGPYHASTEFHPSQAAIVRLIHAARQLADVVILDVPSTMDTSQFETLDAADFVLLVGEQTVPSMQLTCESLRLGIRAHSPLIVINRFDSKLDGFDASHLAQVLGTDQLRTVAVDHDGVNASINRGRPLRLTAPHSRTLVDIDQLAEDLLGKHRQTGRPQGMFGRLAHALGVN